MAPTQRMKQANAKADGNITKRGQVSKVGAHYLDVSLFNLLFYLKY